MLAKQYGLYAHRRPLQIVASVAVALIVVGLFLYGLFWIWHYIKRYRLAIGFAALAVGFGIIRFISLHEAADGFGQTEGPSGSIPDLSGTWGPQLVLF